MSIESEEAEIMQGLFGGEDETSPEVTQEEEAIMSGLFNVPEPDPVVEEAPTTEDVVEGQTPYAEVDAYGDGSGSFIKNAVGKTVDAGIAGIEGLGTLTTGLLATPVSGLAGLSIKAAQQAGFYEGVDTTQVIEDSARALTYQPRTEYGESTAGIIAWPFHKLDQFGTHLGDVAFEKGASPQLAAAIKTGTVMLAPVGILKTSQATGKYVVRPTYDNIVNTAELTLSKQARAKALQAEVAEGLVKELGENAVPAKEIAVLKEKVPGYEPTLAEATKAPAVIRRESTLAAESEEAFMVAANRRKANIQAVQDFAVENFGEQATPIHGILVRAKGDIDTSLSLLEKERGILAKKRQAVGAKVAETPLEQVGERLREIEKQEMNIAKAEANLLYERVGNPKVNATRVGEKVKSLFEDELLDFSQDQIPPSFKLINRVLNERAAKEAPQLVLPEGVKPSTTPADIPFNTLRSLQKRIRRDIASEDGSFKPDRTKIRMLSQVADVIEGVKKDMVTSGGLSSNAATALAKADAFYSENVANRFYKGAAKDISAKTAFNEYRIVPDKVIDSFFSTATTTKGGVKGIKDFITTYGENPEAWAQLRLGVLQKFRDAVEVTKTGEINQAKADVFLNKYKTVLEEVPNIRNELTGYKNQVDSLADAQAAIKGRETLIQSSELMRLVKTETLDTLIPNIMKNAKKLGTVLGQIKGNKPAKIALSKAIGENLINQASRANGSIDSAKMANLMKKNKTAMNLAMGKEHVANLEMIHDIASRMDAAVLPKAVQAPKLGLERIQDVAGVSAAEIQSAWRAKTRGMIGGGHMVTQLISKGIIKWNQKQVNAIERAAHYDPQVAKTLAAIYRLKTTNIPKSIELKIDRHLYEMGMMSGSQRATQEDRE